MKQINLKKIFIAYALLLLALGVVIYAVLGANVSSPVFSTGGSSFFFKSAFEGALAKLLLQLLVIIFFAQVLGKFVSLFNQPAVIGEILGGILLGPSFLGLFFPEIFQFIFPVSTLGVLQAVSYLGLLLFMFSVGMHTRPQDLKDQGPAVLFISHASILIPFTIGVGLSLYLSPYGMRGMNPTAFALFCGIALSITAFPVLARILYDRKITNLPQSQLALSCAAIDDVTAWVILAGIVAIAKGQNLDVLAWTFFGSVAGVILLFKVIAPFLERLLNKTSDRMTFVISVGVLCASALYFEVMGVHALFGAFLAGTIIPKVPQVQHTLNERLEPLSKLVLLPVFFAVTGLRTQITLLNSPTLWIVCGVIILAAIFGKFGGASLSARLCGFTWKDSAFLGILMNTRGLMELVALNIGLELGIISSTLFAMMVIMALVTTLMAGPLLTPLRISTNCNKVYSS